MTGRTDLSSFGNLFAELKGRLGAVGKEKAFHVEDLCTLNKRCNFRRSQVRFLELLSSTKSGYKGASGSLYVRTPSWLREVRVGHTGCGR